MHAPRHVSRSLRKPGNLPPGLCGCDRRSGHLDARLGSGDPAAPTDPTRGRKVVLALLSAAASAGIALVGTGLAAGAGIGAFVGTGGAVLALTVAASPARAEDPALALLERHVAWLGGRDRLTALRTLDLEGTMEASGLTGSVRVRMARPDHLRLEYDLTVVDGIEVLRPEGSWRRNESGQIEDLGRESIQAHRRTLEEAFALWILEPSGDLRVEDLGTQSRAGRDWRVLGVVRANGDRQNLYLDGTTGALLGSEVTADGSTYWSEPGDWRMVDGLRLPFLQSQIYAEEPARNVTLRWERITADADLDAEVFARPSAGREIGGLAAGAASSGWMEMTTFLDRYIYVPAKINGTDTEVLLDSGAGITVVSAEMAARIGLATAGALHAQGVAGSTTASIAEGVDLDLGALHLAGLRVAVIDLSGVEKMLTRGIPVILGKEVFHRFVVDIDYPNRRIAFHEPSRFVYDGPGHSLDLVSDDGGHKSVLASIEGRSPALVKIDTGAGDALSIFAAYTEKEKLLEGRSPLSDVASGGVGGSTRTISRTGTLRSFELAGYVFENVPVSFHEATGAFDTELAAANLGATILSRFRCLFDYTQNRLILEPGTDWQRSFEKDRLGLAILAGDEGIEVIHVASGSPAEHAGWKVGDRVVSINGEELGAAAQELWWKYSRGPAGEWVVVAHADGRLVEMVLAEFY